MGRHAATVRVCDGRPSTSAAKHRDLCDALSLSLCMHPIQPTQRCCEDVETLGATSTASPQACRPQVFRSGRCAGKRANAYGPTPSDRPPRPRGRSRRRSSGAYLGFARIGGREGALNTPRQRELLEFRRNMRGQAAGLGEHALRCRRRICDGRSRTNLSEVGRVGSAQHLKTPSRRWTRYLNAWGTFFALAVLDQCSCSKAFPSALAFADNGDRSSYTGGLAGAARSAFPPRHRLGGAHKGHGWARSPPRHRPRRPWGPRKPGRAGTSPSEATMVSLMRRMSTSQNAVRCLPAAPSACAAAGWTLRRVRSFGYVLGASSTRGPS